MAGTGTIQSDAYVVVWMADDPSESDGNPQADTNGVITTPNVVTIQIERRAQYHWDAVAGVPANLVRVSVGLEHPDDVWRDIAQALDEVALAAGVR